MVSITVERLWMASEKFSIFRQISQVRTCNNFQFLNHHGASELSIKKAPYQAKIYQDLIKMVSITMERLWMVSERFSIFRQISQLRTCNNFQFLNHHGASELSIKKAPNQAKIYQDLIKMVSITLERLWMASEGFSIFRQISQVRTCNNFQFLNHHGASKLSFKKDPNQAKIYQDLIKMMSVTLESLWLVSDRIVDFRFFVKFHRSGPAIIFNFLTITEQVRYLSKKLLIKQRYIKTSSRW